jgi:PhoH-like ATPase
MNGTPALLEGARQLAASTAKLKSYILDTNVVLLDSRAIFNFEDNYVVLPAAVLEELDRIKTEQDSERGRNAREVHRILLELFPNEHAIKEGVKLPGGGKLLLAIPEGLEKLIDEKVRRVLGDLEKKDNQILLTALYVKDRFPPPTVLVTNDANVALKARALGLAAEDYRTDNVDRNDVSQDRSCEVVAVTAHQLQAFGANGELQIPDAGLTLNQYVLLRTPEDHAMPARATAPDKVGRLHYPESIHPGTIGIRARNLEQRFLCDALFDPAIRLLTVRGQAGTGKTLLAIAAGLAQSTGPDARYERVLISRPVITVGKDIGFLPGTIKEKLDPFLQPYMDALEILYSARTAAPQFQGMKQSRRKGKQARGGGDPAGAASLKPYERLLRSGLLQIEAMQFIRGRSIPNSFIIVDEAQNLSRGEVRTLVTRLSTGSKLVLCGDETQIDHCHLDALSNGLVQVAVKMKGLPFAAQVNLIKGERSEVAEAGARLL